MSSSVGAFVDAVEEERLELGFTEVKVCVVVGLDGEYGFFFLDLSNGDADVDDEFSEIKPKFRVPLEAEAIPILFYGLNGRLYIFVYDSLKDRHGGALELQVYTIRLSAVSEEISNSNIRLDITNLEKCADCLGPKTLPAVVAYDGKILLFSTEIKFRLSDLISIDADDSLNDATLTDFELYDPEGRVSTKLPQLHVCRPTDCYKGSSGLRLFNSAKSKFSEKFDEIGVEDPVDFSIVSYCVDGDNFIINTDFGCMFSLNLKLNDDDDGWRLCEEGYVFESRDRNIVTPNGLCLNAFGANDYRRRWLQSRQYLETRDGKRQKFSYSSHSCVRFPVTPIDPSLQYLGGRNSSAVNLLKVKDDTCTPCIARLAFDRENGNNYIPSKLYLFLDVLRLNLEVEFPADDDDHKFVKRMMSFKFCVSEYLLLADIAALCYY